jgi:NAD(P)-dependent dehydrogenase (short-subunit alcohol dehydrogenase family)
VVVNDLGGARDGSGASAGPAEEVVATIRSAGGQAVVNADDVSDWGGAERLVRQAVDTFGGLDVLVNNAGILRDRMLVNMTEAEWDAVIKVHLKGTFAPAHFAATYWRDRSKAMGRGVDARLINTTSISGMFGNAGQTNYGAAKAGIAAFTIIAARELARYGVTVNAVAPGALTRMTEDQWVLRARLREAAHRLVTSLSLGQASEADREAMHPRWIAPIVTWLASRESSGVTGRIFEATGRLFAVAEGWHRGPGAEPVDDPTRLGPIVADLVARARKNSGMNGRDLD